MRPRLALLGADDKRGLAEFAAGLQRQGVELVATGRTEQLLRAAGLPVLAVSELTQHPEMLDGRVKTLHPAVHAGILARRDRPQDLAALDQHGYRLIDMVVVNLYPFQEVKAAGGSPEQLVEAIDIGGPTLLRAAAKNWQAVAAVSSPDQYPRVLAELEAGELSPELLAQLARKVFQLTSSYDAAIAAHLDQEAAPEGDWASMLLVQGELRQQLRYGENPHQSGALYQLAVGAGIAQARQLQGPELSYTNWLDADSAWRLVGSIDQAAAVVVKHTNPCGVAVADSALEAFRRAYDCDPRSAYGGVVGLNRPLDRETAEAIAAHFLLLLVVPSVEPGALERLASRRSLRILEVPPAAAGARAQLELRTVGGGLLAQVGDLVQEDLEQLQVVSQRIPLASEWEQLKLAWRVVAGVKSNAVVLCREGMAVGIGAGQMSRVEAVELAVARAGERAQGSCLASDAYFPMPDGLELAAQAGVVAAIHPGGSVKDEMVIAAADQAGMALVATGFRHFRH